MTVIWEDWEKLEEKKICCQNVSTFICLARSGTGVHTIFFLSQNVCVLWEGFLNVICKTSKNADLQKDQGMDGFPSLQLSQAAELERQSCAMNGRRAGDNHGDFT